MFLLGTAPDAQKTKCFFPREFQTNMKTPPTWRFSAATRLRKITAGVITTTTNNKQQTQQQQEQEQEEEEKEEVQAQA